MNNQNPLFNQIQSQISDLKKSEPQSNPIKKINTQTLKNFAKQYRKFQNSKHQQLFSKSHSNSPNKLSPRQNINDHIQEIQKNQTNSSQNMSNSHENLVQLILKQQQQKLRQQEILKRQEGNYKQLSLNKSKNLELELDDSNFHNSSPLHINPKFFQKSPKVSPLSKRELNQFIDKKRGKNNYFKRNSDSQKLEITPKMAIKRDKQNNSSSSKLNPVSQTQRKNKTKGVSSFLEDKISQIHYSQDQYFALPGNSTNHNINNSNINTNTNNQLNINNNINNNRNNSNHINNNNRNVINKNKNNTDLFGCISPKYKQQQLDNINSNQSTFLKKSDDNQHNNNTNNLNDQSLIDQNSQQLFKSYSNASDVMCMRERSPSNNSLIAKKMNDFDFLDTYQQQIQGKLTSKSKKMKKLNKFHQQIRPQDVSQSISLNSNWQQTQSSFMSKDRHDQYRKMRVLKRNQIIDSHLTSSNNQISFRETGIKTSQSPSQQKQFMDNPVDCISKTVYRPLLNQVSVKQRYTTNNIQRVIDSNNNSKQIVNGSQNQQNSINASNSAYLFNQQQENTTINTTKIYRNSQQQSLERVKSYQEKTLPNTQKNTSKINNSTINNNSTNSNNNYFTSQNKLNQEIVNSSKMENESQIISSQHQDVFLINESKEQKKKEKKERKQSPLTVLISPKNSEPIQIGNNNKQQFRKTQGFKSILKSQHLIKKQGVKDFSKKVQETQLKFLHSNYIKEFFKSQTSFQITPNQYSISTAAGSTLNSESIKHNQMFQKFRNQKIKRELKE